MAPIRKNITTIAPYHPYRQNEMEYRGDGVKKIWRPATSQNHKIVSTLKHVGAVRLPLDYGYEPGCNLEIFNCHHSTLAQIFDSKRDLNEIVRKNIASKLLNAIHKIHELKIVSGKICPENIFIDIIDKNDARVEFAHDIFTLCDNDESAVVHDDYFNNFTSVSYIAPEILQKMQNHTPQKQSEYIITKKCDIFSIGCILYQLATPMYVNPFGFHAVDCMLNAITYKPTAMYSHSTNNFLKSNFIYNIAICMIRAVPKSRPCTQSYMEYITSGTPQLFKNWLEHSQKWYIYAFSFNDKGTIENLQRKSFGYTIHYGDYKNKQAIVTTYPANSFIRIKDTHEEKLLHSSNNVLRLLGIVHSGNIYHVFHDYETITLENVYTGMMNGKPFGMNLPIDADKQLFLGFVNFMDICKKDTYLYDGHYLNNNICPANVFVSKYHNTINIKLGIPDFQTHRFSIIQHSFENGMYSKEFYYAPELLNNLYGQAPTLNSMYFSLGCTLYTIVKNGVHPFINNKTFFMNQDEINSAITSIKAADLTHLHDMEKNTTSAFVKEKNTKIINMMNKDPDSRNAIYESLSKSYNTPGPLSNNAS